MGNTSSTTGSRTGGPKKRRVAVVGMGAVTPLGNRMDDTWHGIVEGVSVGGLVQRFDASKYPTKIAYEVRDFHFERSLVTRAEEERLSVAGKFGVMAAVEALAEAALQRGGVTAPERVATCLGVGMLSPDFAWYDRVYTHQRFDDESLRSHIRFFPDQLTSVVARLAGARGPATTIHTACASSGQALGEAYEAVAWGDADVVITGGADSMISPFYFAGFSLLGALSKRNDSPKTASRPFDQERDGFVLGEGACMLVFEEWERARARGARILGEVCGYGVTESAFRITDLHPEGTGPIEAMQLALDDAGIDPSAVGYLNAHGTSTYLNDKIEALAVSKVFPAARCPDLRVSSTKSMTGHMISAAGAIEFAVAIKALEKQVLPPSVNVQTKDPECLVTLTPSTPTSAPLRYALSNSVGFGGSNTALIAGSARDDRDAPLASTRGRAKS